jgi:hypothetical protein
MMYPEEMMQQVVDAYAAGESSTVVAERFGITHISVLRWTRKRAPWVDITVRKGHYAEFDIARALQMEKDYQSGMRRDAVARKHFVDLNTVSGSLSVLRAIRKYGREYGV